MEDQGELTDPKSKIQECGLEWNSCFKETRRRRNALAGSAQPPRVSFLS